MYEIIKSIFFDIDLAFSVVSKFALDDSHVVLFVFFV